MMNVAVTVDEVRAQVKAWKKEGKTVGLVPTMGYLHEGHESLIKRAVAENDKVVVSVFVNPMQFGPTEDLASYPRDFEADSKLCEAAGAALIFHPEPEEMYKDGFCSFVDMTGLTNALCGLSRPVHFRGVCTVVNKLFNIVTPDRAYFGEKDAQQLAVIKRMVIDLNMDIEIVGCPIIREEDGLAKSSRNTYLSPESRKNAVILSRSILLGKKMIENGERNPEVVKEAMRDLINTMPNMDIDYVEIVDNRTMQSVEKIEGEILCAIAVNVNGEARLIDNVHLKVSSAETDK
jgi:pantoate--beta-alanine ligase